MTKIYTKKGDFGETSLQGGRTVSKTDPIVESVGTIDELNATLGVASVYIDQPDLSLLLYHIQNNLFDIGAELSAAGVDPEMLTKSYRVSSVMVEALEKAIDYYDENLKPLTAFILPGGSKGSAYLHLARTVCRRAERRVIASQFDNPDLLIYLNRLSDLLFVLARYLNRGEDVLWKKS